MPNSKILDWGIKSTPARPSHVAWRAGIDFIPQTGIYEIGYWCDSTFKASLFYIHTIKNK